MQLQEPHSMTQTSERGIKVDYSEGRWIHVNAVPLGYSTPALRSNAWRDRIEQIAGVATAGVFASLAPALMMAALWHTAQVAPVAFVFTFVIALAHAVLLGLPLFLVLRSKGLVNVVTSVVFGFAVGAVPDGGLTWPMQHAAYTMTASVEGVSTIIDGIPTAAEWASYIKPVIYCGSLGALGGLAFWVALLCAGGSGKAAPAADGSRTS
jgi:hypothetical protein